MSDLLTPEERAAHDQAVAATGFRRDRRNDGWMVVGPAETSRRCGSSTPAATSSTTMASRCSQRPSRRRLDRHTRQSVYRVRRS